MLTDENQTTNPSSVTPDAPILSDAVRHQLGRQLQALYDPIIDETLDPRLAELMQQLKMDRGQ
jgi:hypothetical protein